MIDFNINTKFKITYSNDFKKNYKKIVKQGKNLNKLKIVINKLANKETLEPRYKDHLLYNDKRFKNCRDCHIEPDWILIYKYIENELVLVLIATGSHAEILDK